MIITVSRALHELFLRVRSSGRVPAECRRIIITLYKGKGPQERLLKLHPMSLLSVPGKVFAHVLLARIQLLLVYKRRLQQSGFTPSRSTVDAIPALGLLATI